MTQKEVIRNPLLLFLICFAIGYMSYLLAWIFGIDTIIQPLKTEEIDSGKTFNGEAITDILYFDLQRIRVVNQQSNRVRLSINNGVVSTSLPKDLAYVSTATQSLGLIAYSIPTFSLETPSLSSHITQIGNVGLGGISVSLGQIILSLKELAHRQGRIITGSLRRYGSNLLMVVILSDPDSRGESSKAWEVRRILPTDNSLSDELIPAMVEDLSFQIAYDLCERDQSSNDEYPQTWQTFKNFTLGLEAYNTCYATGKVGYLNTAASMALLAKSSEPYYSGSYNLLYNIGLSYLNIGRYNESIYLFQNMKDGDILL